MTTRIRATTAFTATVRRRVVVAPAIIRETRVRDRTGTATVRRPATSLRTTAPLTIPTNQAVTTICIAMERTLAVAVPAVIIRQTRVRDRTGTATVRRPATSLRTTAPLTIPTNQPAGPIASAAMAPVVRLMHAATTAHALRTGPNAQRVVFAAMGNVAMRGSVLVFAAARTVMVRCLDGYS